MAECLFEGWPTRISCLDGPDAFVTAGNAAIHAYPNAVLFDVVRPKRAGYAVRDERVGGVHQLKMKVGRRGVPGVPDPADRITRREMLTFADGDRTGSEVDEGAEDVAGAHDDVIAEDCRQS